MNVLLKLIFGFLFMILLTTMLGILSFTNSSIVSDEFTFLIEHDLEILQNAQELHKLIIDAETGQRGFLIVGDDSFLEPYYIGVEKFFDLMKVEKQLVENNPSQVERLENIENLFNKWNHEAAIPEIKIAREYHEDEIDDEGEEKP